MISIMFLTIYIILVLCFNIEYMWSILWELIQKKIQIQILCHFLISTSSCVLKLLTNEKQVPFWLEVKQHTKKLLCFSSRLKNIRNKVNSHGLSYVYIMYIHVKFSLMFIWIFFTTLKLHIWLKSNKKNYKDMNVDCQDWELYQCIWCYSWP